MVEFHAELIIRVDRRTRLPVILQPILRRTRNDIGPQGLESTLRKVSYLPGEGIDTRLRDDVIRERVADVIADGRIKSRSGRIICLIQQVRSIRISSAADGVAQISRIELGRRQSDDAGCAANPVAKTLVGEKEEGPVLPVIQFGDAHRAAHRTAEIMLPVNRYGEIEEAARVEGVITDEIEQIAVVLVGSGLG